MPSSSPVTPRHANDQQQQQQQQGGDHAGVRKGRGVAEEKMVSPRPETPLSAPSDTARPVYVASRELLRACCRVPVYKQRVCWRSICLCHGRSLRVPIMHMPCFRI